MIAALYVETDGPYFDCPGVDPWDVTRDARRYRGPWPVIAHPPCNVWCQLASVNETRWGRTIGDDGGTFAAALAAVRRWGGVLEHPAYSLAWSHYGLPVPARHGWTQTFDDPGMTTALTQAAYGHAARKRTWLYAVGVDPAAVQMDWRDPSGALVVGAGIHSGQSAGRGRVEKTAASRTPIAFRNLLIALAETVSQPTEGGDNGG